jgi:hypothetical protein
MRYVPLCLVLLAACATQVTPESLQRMPIAEVCYVGMVEPDKQEMAANEVRRRNDDCATHKAEIDRIRSEEVRAGATDVSGMQGSGRQGGMGMGRY